MRTGAVFLVIGGLTVAFLDPCESFLFPFGKRQSSSGYRLPQKQHAVKEEGTSEKALTWQESIELLIVPTTPLPQRQVLLQDVISRAPEIRRDVEEAIRDRNVDGLLTEGVKAVRRQLTEDIIPQLTAEPQQAAKVLLQEIPKIAQQSIEKIPKNPKDLAEAVRDISTTLPSEARNVFLRTPEGLETPSFRVIAQTADYQIREYDPYTIVTTDMSTAGPESPVLGSPAATGSAFNTLARYLFGYNQQREAMAMTTPVEIRKSGELNTYKMSFVVPSKYTRENVPRPADTSVSVGSTQQETLAAKEFPGFATDGEVRRQLLSLATALERDGVEMVDPSSYSIFQYNPPYTLPWLRRNEVVVKVRVGGGGSEAEDAVTKGTAAAAETPESYLEQLSSTSPVKPEEGTETYLDKLSSSSPTTPSKEEESYLDQLSSSKDEGESSS